MDCHSHDTESDTELATPNTTIIVLAVFTDFPRFSKISLSIFEQQNITHSDSIISITISSRDGANQAQDRLDTHPRGSRDLQGRKNTLRFKTPLLNCSTAMDNGYLLLSQNGMRSDTRSGRYRLPGTDSQLRTCHRWGDTNFRNEMD